MHTCITRPNIVNRSTVDAALFPFSNHTHTQAPALKRWKEREIAPSNLFSSPWQIRYHYKYVRTNLLLANNGDVDDDDDDNDNSTSCDQNTHGMWFCLSHSSFSFTSSQCVRGWDDMMPMSMSMPRLMPVFNMSKLNAYNQRFHFIYALPMPSSCTHAHAQIWCKEVSFFGF